MFLYYMIVLTWWHRYLKIQFYTSWQFDGNKPKVQWSSKLRTALNATLPSTIIWCFLRWSKLPVTKHSIMFCALYLWPAHFSLFWGISSFRWYEHQPLLLFLNWTLNLDLHLLALQKRTEVIFANADAVVNIMLFLIVFFSCWRSPWRCYSPLEICHK